MVNTGTYRGIRKKRIEMEEKEREKPEQISLFDIGL